jgi:Subtilase family
VPNKSKFLTHHRYFELDAPHNGTVFSFYRLVREGQIPFVQDVQVNSIPLIKSGSAVSPDDPSYGSGNTGQWNLRHIHADTGWDLSTGSPDVAIWVIDDGFDSVDRSTVDQRTDPHPDIHFNHPGIDLSTMLEIDPDIWLADASGEGHGSACAGIAAATTNNTTGIASVAGGLHPTPGCRIYPLCLIAPIDSTQYANAFNFAATVQSDPMQQTGIPTPLRGSVISISHGVPWDTSTETALGLDASVIDIEINKARVAGIVVCASSGNDDRGDNATSTPDLAGVTYPATNPFVIACGASNQSDTRVTTETAPDGTRWGTNYGTHLSVLAPGVAIPSTDLQDLLQPMGPAQRLGYSTGDYVANFWGTSAAAPQVAGLAALLRSRYDLTATQVRKIIERTAQKTGSIPYEELSSKPHGPWNNQMGYGLIDVFRALDFADVMIKDHPLDDGTEPFDYPNPLPKVDLADIVIRPRDDVRTNQDFDFWRANVHTHLVNGQENFLYVRLTNNGPNTARNVNVTTWLVAPEHAGRMPNPLTDTIRSYHRIPLLKTTLPIHSFSLAANASTMVTYVVSAKDISWMKENWTPPPIVQAVVSAENDYAFETASKNGPGLIIRRNNLAAARLSIVSSDSIPPSAPQSLRVQ